MGEICAYSITGQYGLPRHLFYALLLISLVFHKIQWLVGGTLGASMVYSSIAAAHSVALASARGAATVDLDIIPVFAVTSVSTLVSVPMMVWSKTLREAATSLRAVLFAWMALMFVGVMASMATLKALPAPLPCDNHTTDKTCALNCTTTLPIRRRQSIVVVSFKWKSFLFDWSGYFVLYGAVFALIGLMFAMTRTHPDVMVVLLRNEDHNPRRGSAARMKCCAIFAPPISIAFVVVQIVITEVIISGLPLGEDLTSVGQWGPWVGAGFALLGTIIQWTFSPHPIRSPSTSLISSTPNLRHGRSDYTSPSRMVIPDSSSIKRNPFKDGAEWGTALEGLSFTQKGHTWAVQDGTLRCIDTAPQHPASALEPDADIPMVRVHPPKPCELSTDIKGGHWYFITDDGVEWRIEDGYLRRVEKPKVVIPDSGPAVNGGNEDSNGCHERVLDLC